MSYYGAGDYYGAGGLGSFIKGVGKAALGFVTGGPAGAIASVAQSVGARPQGGAQLTIPQMRITPQAFLPGGTPLLEFGRKKRRRMNPLNPKALNRASRRMDSFVGHAKKALKHTNYKVVSKSAGKPQRRGAPGIIVETGPGGVRA